MGNLRQAYRQREGTLNLVRHTGILPMLYNKGLSFPLRLLVSVLFYIAVLAFGYGFADITIHPLLVLFPVAALIDVIRFIFSIAHWTPDAVTAGIGALLIIYLTIALVQFLLGKIPLIRLLTIALAIIFIYAAVPKILEVNEFTRSIRNYRILPAWSLNLLALWLPWIELIAGGGLLLKMWERGGSTIILVLLVIFTIAVISAVIRGLDIDCGCFGRTASDVARAHRVGFQKIAGNIGMIVIAVLLALSFLIKEQKGNNPVSSRT
jgi:putative oxidoreductase